MKYSFSIILFLFYCALYAQPQYRAYNAPDTDNPLHNFGDTANFPTNMIADDFGPRKLDDDDYNWHGGIDYNSGVGNADLGDLLLSLEAGIVSSHSIMTGTNNVKTLAIEGSGADGHNLRYGHVFTCSNPVNGAVQIGGCRLQMMDSPNEGLWAVVIMDNGNYSAIGPTQDAMPGSNSTVTFTDENNMSRTIDVTNVINSGDPIGALGTSCNYYAHLHLEILTQLTNNGTPVPPGNDLFAKDPLQLYDHPIPTYNIGFYHQDDVTEGITINYPGNTEETIQVHVELDGQQNNDPANRYDVVMNVDDVEILLKREGETDFNTIKGPNYESLFSHGGRIGVDRVNMELNISNVHVGNYDRTHMQPFAYANPASGHHPRDDYYFADFVHRIHKDDEMDGSSDMLIADCPSNARYNDGDYVIKTRVTDVEGGYVDSDETAFNLDNFQPYIESLAFTTVNGPVNYVRTWNCGSCGISLSPSPIVEVEQSDWMNWLMVNPQLTLDVIASEPLEELTLDIYVENTLLASDIAGTVLAGNEEWIFEIGYLADQLTGLVNFRFEGSDSNGNPLIAFTAEQQSCVQVPVRNGSDTWENPDGLQTGVDAVHSVTIGCGSQTPGDDCVHVSIVNNNGEGPTLDADASNVTATGAADGSINLTVTEGTPPYTFDWSNGATTEDLNNLPPGEYCVTVTDDMCSEATLCEPVCSPMEFEFEAVSPCPGSYFGSITVTNIIGGQGPFSYIWNNGATGNYADGLIAGNYCVAVVDVNGCIGNGCFELFNELSDGCSDDNNDDCPELIGNIFTVNPCFGQSNGALYAVLSQGSQVSSYEWSNGVTTPYNSNIPAGYYCVTVTDVNSCVDVMCQNLEEQTSPLSVTLTPTPPSSPTAADASITASIVGGYQPYEYLWTGPNGFTATTQNISGIVVGDYCLRVRSAGCFETTECVTIEYTCPDLISGIQHNGFIKCEGETGSFTVALTGEGTPPVSILWSNGATTQTIDDLAPGYYSVTVSDAVGCSNSHGLELLEANDPLEVEVDITSSCYATGGAINLDVSGGNSPYGYAWNNGQITSTISNLIAGEYCVTVTDNIGCTFEECYTISSSDTEVSSVNIQDNSCGSSCDGSINIEVNSSESVSYIWNESGATTEDLYGLCSGDYTVNIFSGDCVDTYTYTINGEEEDFEHGVDYEVEVVWHFNNSANVSGDATVRIMSDLIEDGDIFVSTSPSMTPIIASHFVPFNVDYTSIDIPEEYANTSMFYFRHIASDGCIHDGFFDMIPSCTFPDVGFSFNIDHVGDEQQACGTGQNHSYEITVNAVGNNGPYYIEVTMNEAAHPSEQNFKKIEKYPGGSSFIIDGIPAGDVHFEAKNKCEYGSLQSKNHTNCCFGIECGVEYEGYTDSYDGSYFYDYPYFRLYVGEICFDPDCTLFDQNCSEVWVDLHTSAPQFNCWTGTVTIDYPDNTSRTFEVVENSPGADQLVWLTSDNRWKPNNAGTYDIVMTYEGTGASIGQNCEETLQIDFYGNGNFSNAVGFNDDFWFDIGAPSQFMDSYFGAWRCKLCSPDPEYILGNNQGACSSFNNWEFTFFDFTPNSFEDPCNSGGSLQIMDFDENGNPVIQTVEIPAGHSIGELTRVRPFGVSVDEWCDNAGWCLFDPATIAGLYDNVEFDKPLLATWADPESCEDLIWDISNGPNPEPCTNDDENPCPLGFVCIGGNCYEECEVNEDCFDGTCIGNYCIEDDDCNPACPSGYNCYQGNCYWEGNICHFYESVTGGSGTNTYEFYHELDPGTEITFYYNALSLQDYISISGSGISQVFNCVTGTHSQDYIITGGNTITIEVIPCQANSEYDIGLSCADPFQGDGLVTFKSNNEKGNDFLIYPNPFNTRIEIVAQNLEDAFDGTVILLDNMGREITSKHVSFETGNNRTYMEGLDELSSGIYFVLIKKEGQIYTSKKIVKME